MLERIRRICAKLPGTTEKPTYGHPGFRVAEGYYVILEEYKKKLSIVVKVGTVGQDLFLEDPRYYETPYIGKRGWVSLHVHAAPLDWVEIRGLIVGSYKLVRAGKARKRPATRS